MIVKKTYFDTLADVVKSIVTLTPAQEAKPIRYVRLEENKFVLTKEIDMHTQVVTAHKLSQYLNPKYSVRLDDSVECWFDWLLDGNINELEAIVL